MRHWLEKFEEAIKSGDLGLQHWTHVRSSGCPPSKRAGHSALQCGRDVYFFGGVGTHYCYNDLYDFQLSDSSWRQIAPATDDVPPPRHSHSAALLQCDDSDEMFIFGGEDLTQAFGDLYRCNFKSGHWVKVHATVCSCPWAPLLLLSPAARPPLEPLCLPWPVDPCLPRWLLKIPATTALSL